MLCRLWTAGVLIHHIFDLDLSCCPPRRACLTSSCRRVVVSPSWYPWCRVPSVAESGQTDSVVDSCSRSSIGRRKPGHIAKCRRQSKNSSFFHSQSFIQPERGLLKYYKMTKTEGRDLPPPATDCRHGDRVREIPRAGPLPAVGVSPCPT